MRLPSIAFIETLSPKSITLEPLLHPIFWGKYNSRRTQSYWIILQNVWHSLFWSWLLIDMLLQKCCLTDHSNLWSLKQWSLTAVDPGLMFQGKEGLVVDYRFWGLPVLDRIHAAPSASCHEALPYISSFWRHSFTGLHTVRVWARECTREHLNLFHPLST